MNWFKNLKISSKLSFAFGLIWLVLVSMAYFAINRLEMAKKDLELVLKNLMPASVAISDLNTHLANYRRKELLHIMSNNMREMKDKEKQMDEERDLLEIEDATFEQLLQTERDRKLHGKLQYQLKDYFNVSKVVLKLSYNHFKDSILAILVGDARTTYFDAQKTIDPTFPTPCELDFILSARGFTTIFGSSKPMVLHDLANFSKAARASAAQAYSTEAILLNAGTSFFSLACVFFLKVLISLA